MALKDNILKFSKRQIDEAGNILIRSNISSKDREKALEVLGNFRSCTLVKQDYINLDNDTQRSDARAHVFVRERSGNRAFFFTSKFSQSNLPLISR